MQRFPYDNPTYDIWFELTQFQRQIQYRCKNYGNRECLSSKSCYDDHHLYLFVSTMWYTI